MIKRYVISVALAAVLCAAAFGSLTAPETVKEGELAVVKSDTAATWTVFPPEYKTAIYIADEGKTCIFASPKPGVVTFVAAAIVDGKIELSEITLYNGVQNPEPPTPTPEPPQPETIEQIITNTDIDATEADYTALASAFETVVNGINRGTIRTPAGARETFRANWVRQAGLVNPNALTTFSQLLTKLSSNIDNTDLTTVRKDYKTIIDALKAKAKQTVKAKPTENKQTCPNGQCQTYWRYR